MTISHKRNRIPSIVNLSKGITRRMPAKVFSSCKTSNIGASYSSMITTTGFPFFDMHDELAQSANLQGLFHFYSFHIGETYSSSNSIKRDCNASAFSYAFVSLMSRILPCPFLLQKSDFQTIEKFYITTEILTQRRCLQ